MKKKSYSKVDFNDDYIIIGDITTLLKINMQSDIGTRVNAQLIRNLTVMSGFNIQKAGREFKLISNRKNDEEKIKFENYGCFIRELIRRRLEVIQFFSQKHTLFDKIVNGEL